VPDSTRPHPPTPWLDEEAREPRLPDVAAWSPPEPEADTGAGAEAERLAGLAARVAPEPTGAVEPEAREARPSRVPSRSPRRPPEEAGAPRPPEGAVRTAPQPPLTGKPTPPLDLPLPVLVLTEQARRASAEERPALASRLNTLLEQMAGEGGDRQVADTFHRLLESGKLEGLVDPGGRSCRAVAVESLLSLGFPYALEVRPEDLEHLRASGHGGPAWKGLQKVPLPSLLVLLAGLGTQYVQELLVTDTPDGPLTVQVGLSLLAMMALWLAPPRSPVYRLGLGLLALVSCLALVLPLLSGVPLGLWAGLAGLVAVFLAALRES
jgi:hypothetical protein